MRSYSAQEVADRLGISIFTLRRHIRAGRLPAERIDGQWQIRREDLEAFLQDREIALLPTRRDAPAPEGPSGQATASSPDLPSSSARTRSSL